MAITVKKVRVIQLGLSQCCLYNAQAELTVLFGTVRRPLAPLRITPTFKALQQHCSAPSENSQLEPKTKNARLVQPV